jgi:DNA repair exonuclease SbcCD ATPase subunit
MSDGGGLEVMKSDDLYALPLDRFTAARDSLSRRLKAEGDEEGARQVSAMRKPSVAAWALNQVAREDPEAVAGLVESHRRLREAGSRQEVEEASRQRRELVARLTDEAMAGLGSSSLQTRDRVNRTLLAVATDQEGESNLEAGTLVRELEPTGIGWGEIDLPPPPPPDPAEEARRLVEEANTRVAKLESEAESAEQEVERLKEAMAQAKDRSKKARAAARKAAEELRRAQEASP